MGGLRGRRDEKGIIKPVGMIHIHHLDCGDGCIHIIETIHSLYVIVTDILY